MEITSLIVTCNRKDLLNRCLSAVAIQSRRPDHILVLNNASTDGTREMLQARGWLNRSDVELIDLEQNTGGAGGFSAGMQRAMEIGTQWIWMMDDDAEPHPDALKELVRIATDLDCIYGSIAVSGSNTSWPMHGVDGLTYSHTASFPDQVEVVSLPFLGFMVSAKTVERIGYPDVDYFIAGDDHEYCLRARKQGIRIFACGKSLISHPASHHYQFGIGRFRPTCYRIQPWKRYYDVRNRIISAVRHEGLISAWTKTVPATLIRWLASMINEPDRLTQSKAYAAGIWDGLLMKKGKRHLYWVLQ